MPENIERIDAASLQLIYLFIEEAKVKNVMVDSFGPGGNNSTLIITRYG